MARLSMEDLDKLCPNQSSYFTLKEDGDASVVRFLYDHYSDIMGESVHVIKIDDKERYVSCLRENIEDVCPFCQAGNAPVAKYFIQLAILDEKTLKFKNVSIWERSKNYMKILFSILEDETSDFVDKSLYSLPFKVKRIGAKGDPKTTYDVRLQSGKLGIEPEEMPEQLDLYSAMVMRKTEDEMNYYVDNGSFPEEGVKPRQSSKPVARSNVSPRSKMGRDGETF